MRSSTDKGERAARLKGAKLSLLVSVANLTWRMLIPPVVLVFAGIYADLKYGTRPWLTMLAAVLGLAASAWLVKRQLEGMND